MSGTLEPPGSDAGGSADRGLSRLGVTAALGSDAVILMLARKTVEAGGGSAGAYLAARRELDRELRALVQWPSGADYARAAADFERLGRPEDAALLRGLAATDTLIAAARTEWNTRYDVRPRGPMAEMMDAMRQEGIIDFDPASPYPGVDGAAYEPGAVTIGGQPEPVLAITGRGAAELLTDWSGFDAMSSWVASRGTTASGPLTPPPAGDSRAWSEDQVLARLVTSPLDAPQLLGGLAPSTFTTDVRYDLYQAVMAVAAQGAYYEPEQVADELGRRIAAVPPYALASYGGAAGLFARAYLARLSSTEVTAEAAQAAAVALAREDTQPRPTPAHRPQAANPRAGAELHHGERQAPGLPLQQPQLRPPDAGGPVVVPRP